MVRRNRVLGIKARFISAYSVSLLLCCLLLTAVLTWQLRSTLYDELRMRGLTVAEILVDASATALESEAKADPDCVGTDVDGRVMVHTENERLQQRALTLIDDADVEYVIIQDQTGQVHFEVGTPNVDLGSVRSVLVAEAWDLSESHVFEAVDDDGRNLIHFGVPIPNGAGTVRVGMSGARLARALDQAFWTSLILGLGTLAGGVLLLFFTARWSLAPLREMAQATRAIAQGDLSQRVEVSFQDEVGELAQAFNEMSESVATSRRKLDEQYQELQASYAELQEAQSRLAHSEEARKVDRLRTVGQMASGIAHNFNNLMSAIIGRVQLLKLKSETDQLNPGDLAHSLDVIERAGLDGAETVRRIQEFSRGESHEGMSSANLNDLVRSVVEITQPRWKDQVEQEGHRIEIDTQLSDMPSVRCVPSELREVLTNLIFNAIDAMPDGGVIKIETRTGLGFGELRVSDTGIGMSKPVLERVFDPFFTTKGVKGTGLGLSTVYGIIKRQGGEIWADSKEGKGTTFTIRVPYAKSKLRREEDEGIMGTKGYRILVGDDEDNVRETLVDLLRLLGHEVTEASSGQGTLDSFRPDRFDLVMTDLGMPDLSGWEVIQGIRKQDGNVPIVLATGWGSHLNAEDARERGATRVLSKPFTVQKISSLIAELQGELAAA